MTAMVRVEAVTRDTSFVLVSTASQPEIERYKQRMGWDIPWYTVVGTEFQEACGTTEYFALDVFLRAGDRVFLTYATTGRGATSAAAIRVLEGRVFPPRDGHRQERIYD